MGQIKVANSVLIAQADPRQRRGGNEWIDPFQACRQSEHAPVTGVVFTAPKGVLLNIPVADPDHVLPAAALKGPAPLEPQFQLMVKGPDGLYRHAHFVSATATGRTYQIAVPPNTALALRVSSTVANILDQNGSAVQDGVESPFPAVTSAAVAQPASAPQLAFTLHGKS